MLSFQMFRCTFSLKKIHFIQKKFYFFNKNFWKLVKTGHQKMPSKTMFFSNFIFFLSIWDMCLEIDRFSFFYLVSEVPNTIFEKSMLKTIFFSYIFRFFNFVMKQLELELWECSQTIPGMILHAHRVFWKFFNLFLPQKWAQSDKSSKIKQKI